MSVPSVGCRKGLGVGGAGGGGGAKDPVSQMSFIWIDMSALSLGGKKALKD